LISNKTFISPFKEPIINDRNFSKLQVSPVNEYKNTNNENYYDHKMNNFSKVAHEFKTPLNAIIGLISEIKNNPTALSKVLSNINIINNLSNYLIFLITDLTQLINQNMNSNIVIITEPVFLKSIIEFCFEILNSLLICKNSNNNLNTCIEYDDRIDALEVISNDIRIKQILLNFISNSVKFTKSGFIKIKLLLKSKNNTKYIKISVIDSVVGIREEDQKKIFNEILSDLEKESNNHGSGLGLNICKFIAEKLNHSLKFKSIYGEGSKFSLLISESCLKIEENYKNNLNLNKIEINNINNKIFNDKYENKVLNKEIKDIIAENKCDLNKNEKLFLNFNSTKNLRRKSFDVNLFF